MNTKWELSFIIGLVIFLVVVSITSNTILVGAFTPSFWLGIFITSTITIIAILVTLMITDYYHNKKPKSDEHFDTQKNNREEDLRHRVGTCFSWLKQECGVIINKSEIYEHDLVAFGFRDYDQLLSTIDHTSKYVINDRLNYLNYLTSDEFYHHQEFFSTMARFVRLLQVKKYIKTTEIFDKDQEIDFALNNLNRDLGIIKTRRHEYDKDKYSHVTSATLRLSRYSILHSKGIKYYKAPCSIN